MRLERISDNKFKIFLTFDDLIERGLADDLMLENLPGMQILFHDMMIEASDELDMDLSGILTVQIYMIQAQGMLIIVTQEDLDEEDDYIEMQVTLSERKSLLYLFADFEDIIQFAKAVESLKIDSGSIYFYQDHYYLYFSENLPEEHIKEDLIALLSEYASATVVTPDQIFEYGKPIMENKAMLQIRNFFS
ncbi:adaptor protein MecA [Amphibacillus sp. MSJ-3]|uniref:adaptor protein MecA n=1 Tax=Amphibacillus sp. MSJ-3 TaxID=2841505 RepID=UPI001C0EFABA|nr:adaptor protein MecA [Amphibacillus sp. MSJ-3]MBU5594246.1 adaptor protein MecA [Amphibacillus sp. MSJ-3]